MFGISVVMTTVTKGTFITEWEEGEKETEILLSNVPLYVENLVSIATFYQIDGWFINIENKLGKN